MALSKFPAKSRKIPSSEGISRPGQMAVQWWLSAGKNEARRPQPKTVTQFHSFTVSQSRPDPVLFLLFLSMRNEESQ
jgi:hypothetical protein